MILKPIEIKKINVFLLTIGREKCRKIKLETDAELEDLIRIYRTNEKLIDNNMARYNSVILDEGFHVDFKEIIA